MSEPKKRGRKKGTKLVPLQKPLTGEELLFCKEYGDCGNQAEAFRRVWPDIRNPHTGASRLMRRVEIKDQIARILEKAREKAADAAARAMVLTLELADSRLGEVLQARRRTRGEMLTRDTGELQFEGVGIQITPNPSGRGKPVISQTKSEELEKSMADAAPIEDSDLIKAIDLTYKRRAGFPAKPAAPVAPQQTNVFLYQPEWKLARQQQALPAETSEAQTA